MSGITPRQPIVILISGRGSNMRALIERSREPGQPYDVTLVVADQPGAAGLAIADGYGIRTQVVAADKTLDRASYDRRLATAIDTVAPALIVLAGFMRILSGEFVARYAGRILNIHPSLLPKYPGLHTHRQVLAAHEPTHGATVHFVTPQLDGGPPIVQGRVAVLPDDVEATLAARVQVLEHRIYPLAVGWYCAGRVRFRDGRTLLDGKLLEGPVLYDDDASDPAPPRRER